MKNLPARTILAVLVALSSSPTLASAQTWTDWTSSTPWTGTMLGITVNYTGGFVGGQTSCGTNYWAPSGAYTQNGLTAPTNCDFIQFDGPVSGTVSFSSPVVNPYFALISVGQPSVPITFNFGTSPFTVLSNNNTACAFWGCGSYSLSGNTLTGNEFSGTLQFTGTYSSISFTTNPNEFWYGFTVGADRSAESVVPEPASMTLLATGLVGMAAAARKRRRKG